MTWRTVGRFRYRFPDLAAYAEVQVLHDETESRDEAVTKFDLSDLKDLRYVVDRMIENLDIRQNAVSK